MYIVHVGASYFPKGNAAVQRVRFTYRAVQEAGYSPLIINKECNTDGKNLKRANRFDGLPYVYTTSVLRRPSTKVTRKLNSISGLLGEFKLLFKRRKKISAVILYNTSSFSELIYYRIISRLLGFKLVFQYVEYRSSFADRSFFNRLNDKLFDNYCSYFADGVIIISEFLRAQIRKKNKDLPLIKIPVICDFEEFNVIPQAKVDYSYFLYCGTTEYLPVINFITELYEKVRERNLYSGNLMFIIGVNNQENLEIIKKNIRESRYSENIILQTNMQYKDIIPLYKSADLLLIPLRNSIQDIARFPHKIGEYTASKRPLISTNVGELKYYFKNGESAILADDYTVESYLEFLTPVLSGDRNLDEIGRQGYNVGYNNFHFVSNAEPIKTFFDKLCNHKQSKMALAVAH